MGLRWVVRVALAVGRRPGLWTTAVRQAWRLRRTGWWRRAPFLPVPPEEYLAFRTVTAYGDPDRPADPDDVIVYLDWCRSLPRA